MDEIAEWLLAPFFMALTVGCFIVLTAIIMVTNGIGPRTAMRRLHGII